MKYILTMSTCRQLVK